MSISRRNFLKGSAAAIALLSTGGVFHAFDQGAFSTGKGSAYEPWRVWNQEDINSDANPLFRLIKASILASNAHNTQPWLYRIGNNEIDLYANVSRNIGTIDPLFREMNISLGCAIENLELAAKASDFETKVTLYPGGFEQIRVANIVLTPAVVASPDHYSIIGKRHTNRAAYDLDKQVEPATLQEMSNLANSFPDVKIVWFSDEAHKTEIGNVIINATEAIIGDKTQSGDSHKWYRHDWDELQRNKDGISIDSSGNSGMTRFFGKVLPTSIKSFNDYWIKLTKNPQVSTASVFGMLLVRNQSDRTQLIQAGRLWQRMHLWAVTKGLAAQPLNQPHERRDREVQLGIEPIFGKAIEKLVNTPGYEGMFTFRMGYPTSQALASPRRPAEEVLLT
ncbi:twin-arginine translocation signal domain-containing protein [Paenibacillus sp. GSMTC-2017]|uniref:twin-arginine translocation signal domain-containing protein n=1 Tax=Paenibacillus sp. GSMTC-2017 TaxID=2794350 RepID=UPI0018DA00E7|nr:twin-arginine translocation signal domain-containing protein [Paenibacillus sp. GSMTC-2017]MBH5320908.1 twin-arginine translocation signal domain-containing protein [Paenibacillus sp. GSMTC-2017]